MLLTYAEVQRRGDCFYNPRYDDIYGQGFAESQHVFIAGNDLPARFARGGHFCIGELGFGSGRNFIAAAQCFLNHAPPSARLSVLSFEKHPWRLETLRAAQADWPLPELRAALYRQWPGQQAGFHPLHLHERITLLLIGGEIADTLPETQARVDAWFLDGFAPGKNPDCWRPELCAELARLSHAHTTVATYSAAAAVRTALSDAGFVVKKRSGFGRKRDMLTAVCAQPRRSPAQWWSLPPTVPVTQIAVIGAGIAGATTARALAERGFKVDNFASTAYPPASAVPWALPHLQLGRTDTPARRYYLSAWLASLRALAQFPQVAVPAAMKLENPPPFAELLAPQFGQGDTLQAYRVALPELCAALLEHPRIGRRTATLHTLTHGAEGYLVDGTPYSHLVLCTGYRQTLAPEDAPRFALRPLRGQESLFAVKPAPATIFCGEKTLIPLSEQHRVWVGSSYTPYDEDLRPRPEDDDVHADFLRRTTGSTATLCDHFVGIRAASRDYWPLVGPLTTQESARQAYGLWHKDAGRPIHAALEAYPGLFIHTGLGSRGLSTAFLNAEALTAMVSGDPLPLPRSFLPQLLPARFDIRRIIRRQLLE